MSGHLKYNGIASNGKHKYYSFTYDGESDGYYKNVPQEIINYLLYELAFYRAGFGGGFYYRHICDAMHFTLSELGKKLHEREIGGLRMVEEYI